MKIYIEILVVLIKHSRKTVEKKLTRPDTIPLLTYKHSLELYLYEQLDMIVWKKIGSECLFMNRPDALYKKVSLDVINIYVENVLTCFQNYLFTWLHLNLLQAYNSDFKFKI